MTHPTTPSSTTSSPTPEASLFTRADYMAKRCTHEQYYDQYVHRGVLSVVRSFIGEAAIVRSTDPNFNDIPLIEWDRLHEIIKGECGRLKKKLDPVAGQPTHVQWSRADTVCIAKAAAAHIRRDALAVDAVPAAKASGVPALNEIHLRDTLNAVAKDTPSTPSTTPGPRLGR